MFRSTALILAVCFGALSHAADRVGHHGMLVFGTEDGYFLTHIPMFHEPHDAQMILQVELAESGKALKKNFADKPFSFSPSKVFSLDDLAAGKIAIFSGDIYRGSFEAGGTIIHRAVTVKVVKVLAMRGLPGTEKFAASPTYYLVQNAKQAFLLNYITAKRDWQSVLKLESPLAKRTDALTLVQSTSEIADTAQADVQVLGTDGGATGETVGVKTTGSLWCLAGPDFVEPCK